MEDSSCLHSECIHNTDPSMLHDLKQELQAFFSDGLVIIVGSGLSVAEGIPGMGALAKHLRLSIPPRIKNPDESNWTAIEALLNSGEGLEAALLKMPPSADLELLIVEETSAFLQAAESTVFLEVLENKRTLRLARLLPHVLKPREGLPIVTTNYDRLIELAAEILDLGVDTMFVGSTVGKFDEQRSRMSFIKHVDT